MGAFLKKKIRHTFKSNLWLDLTQHYLEDGLLIIKWTMANVLSTVKDQIFKSCKSMTPSICSKSFLTFSKDIPTGNPSIRILKVSFKMVIVVAKTITAKIKVQMGSANLYSGLILMTMLETSTPMDWMKSPSTWINAALTLIWWWFLSLSWFSWSSWLFTVG